MYQRLHTEAERLTGQIVMKCVDTKQCDACGNHRHWVIVLPCGIIWWRKDDNGDPFPIHEVYCHEETANGWLAGFLAAWNDYQGGVDETLVQAATKYRESPFAHITTSYRNGRLQYNGGRWDRSSIKAENVLDDDGSEW